MSHEPCTSRHLGPLASMRWWRMTLKELREILRDRRTILTLIGMPLLIYPLLGVTFQKLLVSQAANKSKIEYRIALVSQRDSRVFRDLFQKSAILRAKQEGALDLPRQEPAGTVDDPIWTFLESRDKSATVDVDHFVANRSADVGVRLKSGGEEGPWEFELTYRSASLFSLDARRAIEDRLRTINDYVVLERLHEQDPSFVMPLGLTLKSVVPTDAGSSFSMATLIPLILILMTVTGAVYPAIDLTAGERERGTLEALISAPVPRHELLFAKYLAVLAVAMLTAIANLTSMVITAYSNGMEQLLFGSGGVSFRMLILILGLLIVFAGFFAAVILILTSFARSFKEAQAYLIPVMLVSLAPGVLCLLPGIEMTAWMSVTPLVNIVILARDVFDGRAQPIWVVATLLSTVLYSAVALALAAKIFGTDAVLYGSEGSWADLIRRPTLSRPAASLSQAMACLAVLFPAFLVLSGVPGRLMGEWVAGRLIGNAIITIVLFAVMPLALARWSSIDLSDGFRLRGATIASFLAATILGLSLWPFAIELARFQTNSLEQSDAIKELFERVSASLNAIPLPAKLLALALIPAVCEELFFRGYLQSAFRSGMSTSLAVILSSCLFGLFHVIATLSFERFAPTCFLGLVLGWVCYRTGSVLPGMVLHTIHNSLIILMQDFVKELAAMGIGTEADQHVPTSWLVGAGLAITLAIGILFSNAQGKQDVAATSLIGDNSPAAPGA